MTTQEDPEYIVKLLGVKKSYGSGNAETFALQGIDMRVKKGEFVAVMGPSGSGKSTAMNIIGCLDAPTQGVYFFDGIEVDKLSRNRQALLRRYYIGFIFQGFNLLNRTTALENVELPLVYRGVSKGKRRKMAKEALKKVGLETFENHTPGELSGGQQQRVAIARAIVTKPLVLLADEPTGNLDSARSLEIMQLLKEFNKELGITVLMVTHEEEMAAFADRSINFKDGLIQKGEG